MRFRLPAAAVLGLVLLAGRAPAVVPPAAVTVRASSGQAYEGFIVAPGDVHSFLLEDFYPMTYSVALKAGKGSTLLPDIALYDPAALDITPSLVPYRKDGAKSVAVKNAPGFASAGRHVLQVKGKTGTTGSYLLKVTAKVVKSFRNTGICPSDAPTSFEVFAPTEALVTVKVVPGSGSTLVPRYLGVAGSDCAAEELVPSTKPGQATFVSGLTADHSVSIEGDGGTGGSFNWTAKVKMPRPSKKPVRVNGGAPFFAEPGPAGGILTANAGQSVAGFGADPLGLCWREVRTTGGGPNGNKNSFQAATLTGGNLPSPGNNVFTDAAPDFRAFAVGRTFLAAFDFAGGNLRAIRRDGTDDTILNDTLGTALRLLADGDSAFHMRADGIRRYAFDGSVATGVSTNPSYAYLDMALGGVGVVYAAGDGGDLVIGMADRDAGGADVLATLSPNPGFQALAARGPDAFFAVSDGNGGASLYRASACDPGSAVPLCPDFGGPVRAMAADDQNVYALEDDAEDGVRVRQIPRGGGESMVIFRSADPSFTIDGRGLAAAGGYVLVLADSGGKETFYRVKRR